MAVSKCARRSSSGVSTVIIGLRELIRRRSSSRLLPIPGTPFVVEPIADPVTDYQVGIPTARFSSAHVASLLTRQGDNFLPQGRTPRILMDWRYKDERKRAGLLLGMRFQPVSEKLRCVLAEFAIFFAEGRGEMAVNIELSHYFTAYEHGNYNLRSGFR